MLPRFELLHPEAEAAWNGLIFSSRLPTPRKLFSILKANFVGLFETDWMKDAELEDKAAQLAVLAAYWGLDGKGYLSKGEARDILRLCSDRARASAVWYTGQIVAEENGWTKFGRIFLRDIWPLEARYQSAQVADRMLYLAEGGGDHFPEIVEAILPYLRPMDHPDMVIFRERRSQGPNTPIVQRWPAAALEVVNKVVPEDPRAIPYDLGAFLQDAIDADPSLRETTAWKRLQALVER